MLLERAELTSGSTWHAAGGMHTINGDPNVAKLQKYTIELYKEIEEYSGQATGVHLTGGVLLAATEARLDWLRGVVAKGRYLGIELEGYAARAARTDAAARCHGTSALSGTRRTAISIPPASPMPMPRPRGNLGRK